ncbi:thiol reductase thioredoxin [Pseudomonas syringae]|uniref:Thiol reductase thioredoxin n=2 Tax=Pseudomonas syringae TaxID=317 RepID=A0A244EJJ2_PSESX|nr:thiol reductase thioredoxin [Pseudomonas syringae]
MLKTEFAKFVEEQIKLAEKILADGKVSERDDFAEGKLTFFCARHRILQGEKIKQDVGTLDAINDSLQALGILESEETFLNYKKKAGTVLAVKDDGDFNREWAEVSPLVLLEFSKPGVNEHGEANSSARTGAILDELAPEFEGKVVMLRVPVDTCPATAQSYNVTAAPTIIFLKGGKKLEETADFHLKFWFRAKINELLSPQE